MKECDYCGTNMEWTKSAVEFNFETKTYTTDIEAWNCPQCGNVEIMV